MKGWLISGYVMALLLGLSVAVQYNDPDGGLWMVIYGAGFVLTIAYLTGRRWLVLNALAAGAGIVGSVAILLTIETLEFDKILASFQMQGSGVEEVREAFGLLLQSTWLACLAWQTRPATA